MYKFCKNFALIGVLLIIIGCVLGIIVASFGISISSISYDSSWIKEQSKQATTSVEIIHVDESIYTDDNDVEAISTNDTLYLNETDVTFSNVELTFNGNVYIEVSDEFQISTNNIDMNYFDYSYDDETLTISYQPTLNNIINFDQSEIFISLPDNVYESFSINMDMGSCIINDIKTEYMKVNVNFGSLELYTVIAENSDFDIAAGSIELLTCILNNSTFNVDGGSITATDLTITGDNDIDVSLGSIDLHIINHQRSKYLITSKSNGGSVNIVGDIDNEIESIYNMDISVDIGSCEINFD